ncbi:MAG TPA: hypothetical protein VMV68_06940 [Spirochaetia bacterium]|nr:hypothetical protein [Spirochaetia bacterium]
MKREDFIFTIGYTGETAIVDGAAKARFGRMTTRELAEAGLLKPALCSALYSKDASQVEEVLAIYKQKGGPATMSVDQLKRTLGVFDLPDNIVRIKLL